MKKSLIVFLVLIQSLVMAATATDKVAVEEAMRRANDYFLANFSIGTAVWDRSAYHTGNFRAWETLGIQAYYDRSVAWGEANSWLRGPEGISHSDAHCCGQTYIDLYNVDPQPIRTNSITSTLNYVLSSTYYVDDWSWIDAFYMAGPTLARLGVLNSDDSYLSALYDMYMDMKVNRGLFDASRGLWWRDGGYYGTDTYWGRGNGWVIASCARILEQLPSGDPRRPEFESMLRTMASALLPYQQSDGFWRSDIIDPAHYPTPETSCTAFFTYAIAYGVNEGILVDAPGTNYTAAATNAWNGMVTIALHENGELGYAQNIGAAPGPSSYGNDKDYAYGAFLLAGCEILRMLGGPAPVSPDAGADISVIDSDENYTEQVTLNASNSVLRSGSIENYSWWIGTTYLGSGEQLDVDFPLGTNVVTLKIKHSTGNTYTDTRTIKVKVTPPDIVVTASGFQTNPYNPPENTLDGNLGTRWSQEGDDGSEWIQYELPAISELDHIDLAFYSGDIRQTRFALWLSPDTTNNLVRVLPASGDIADYVSSSGTTLDLETFSFSAQPVKYVLIQGWGNSAAGSAWNSITETRIPIPVRTDQLDQDGNGFPDSWEIHYLGFTGQVASAEIGGTGITLGDAYVFGLDPITPDTTPMIGINVVSNQPSLSLQTIGAFGVGYQELSRKYAVQSKAALTNQTWTSLTGYGDYAGNNLLLDIPITNNASAGFYRLYAGLSSVTNELLIPRTYCRLVPERSGDFAWENDQVAFRAYGPELRSGAENGGFDCWLKRVEYPIIDKWYQLDNYHVDNGEGYDPYHVGETLGCGSIGLWSSNALITTETFISSKVVKSEPAESIFELDYLWSYGGHDYKLNKRIRIRMGDRLFNCIATFWQDGVLATGLPVAIGLSTHDGSATADHDLAGGWLSCWETIDGLGLGTGVAMDPGSIVEYRDVSSATPDKSHALLIANTDGSGQVSWWAGYGWEGAGAITNVVEWNTYLAEFDIGN